MVKWFETSYCKNCKAFLRYFCVNINTNILSLYLLYIAQIALMPTSTDLFRYLPKTRQAVSVITAFIRHSFVWRCVNKGQ
jgi:uncharacterized membrane protein